MSLIRPMTPSDLFSCNLTNLDVLTENYDLSFYAGYLARWPGLFNVVENRSGQIIGYIMGKTESSPVEFRNSPTALPWHAHITVLTVAPPYRRLGLADRLTQTLETAGDRASAWFVDLYVRSSNKTAIDMYTKWGYSIYRRVVGYYTDGGPSKDKAGEDAFDMRKPLSRDKNRQHIRENGETFEVRPDDVW